MCFFKPEKISKNNATSCRNVNALSLKSRKKYPLMEKKNFIEYYLGIFSDRIEEKTLAVSGKPDTTGFLTHPEDGATEAATWQGGRLRDTRSMAGILV